MVKPLQLRYSAVFEYLHIAVHLHCRDGDLVVYLPSLGCKFFEFRDRLTSILPFHGRHLSYLCHFHYHRQHSSVIRLASSAQEMHWQ